MKTTTGLETSFEKNRKEAQETEPIERPDRPPCPFFGMLMEPTGHGMMLVEAGHSRRCGLLVKTIQSCQEESEDNRKCDFFIEVTLGLTNIDMDKLRKTGRVHSSNSYPVHYRYGIPFKSWEKMCHRCGKKTESEGK